MQDIRKAIDDIIERYPQIGQKERDPAEKVELLRRFFVAWSQLPEQRFGQLVANACYQKDIFSIEDADLIEALELWIQLRTID